VPETDALVVVPPDETTSVPLDCTVVPVADPPVSTRSVPPALTTALVVAAPEDTVSVPPDKMVVPDALPVAKIVCDPPDATVLVTAEP